MKRLNIFCGVLLLFFLICTPAFSQPASSQTVGGIIQQDAFPSKAMTLSDRLQQKKTQEEVVAEDVDLEDGGQKAVISTINVEGVTLLTQEEIEKITSSYEGEKLSLKGMQKVADLITDEYRAKGYATSRAYIPPQTIKDGVLLIKVVEGRLGRLSFEGNRYFKTDLLESKVELKPYGYFDYSALQRSLVYINEHPDRVARAILVPGQEPGTTDVIIKVQDNYPFHVGFEYDNYGSRFIEKNRYAFTFEHNNLLGFDDKFYFKVLQSDAYRLQMQQGRYIFPVNQKLDVGCYVLKSRSGLGQEYIDLGAGGKAMLYGIFATQALVENPELDIRLNAGFDYKDIKNEISSVETSRDQLRIFKFGVDFDSIDQWGRNILSVEMDFGVPDMMGGMDDKDPNASRANAGATFQKGVFHFFRLHPLPWDTALLWKNSAQYTNHNLVASEQFQIGGATSVRGYPPAEHSGDKGYYSALEWSFPVWGLSKDIKVPYRPESLYDAWRFVLFYDFGFVNLKTPGVGENENQTLKGWGIGTRFNLSDDMSLRVEIGYPDGKTPSDSDHAHPWVEFKWKF